MAQTTPNKLIDFIEAKRARGLKVDDELCNQLAIMNFMSIKKAAIGQQIIPKSLQARINKERKLKTRP